MANSALHNYVNSLWYNDNKFAYLLLPISGIFSVLASIRKHKQLTSQIQFEAPVIIVGNITVGGTGKTPMVIALTEELLKLDYKVGIASRGYRGNIKNATLLDNSHTAVEVGDEPLLIYQKTHANVMIGSNRVEVIRSLINDSACDLVICDDGLQDYRFKHDVEIIMVDGERVFGNQLLLPAGPLREPVKRLQSADFLVAANKVIPAISSDCMKLHIKNALDVYNPSIIKRLDEWKNQTVHAVAGIGNPQRFFDALKSFEINIIEHAFPDHVILNRKDVTFPDQLDVLMTEKDAVKCRELNLDNVWSVPVQAELPKGFISRIINILNK